MTHWIDRLAVRATADSPPPGAFQANGVPTAPLSGGGGLARRGLVNVAADETAEHLSAAVAGIPVPQLQGPFSRRTGLRVLGLAAGLLLAAPLRRIGPSTAGAATSGDCLADCLADEEKAYREVSAGCNSGIPAPVHFLNGVLLYNPLCQALRYQALLNGRRSCRSDCGRKKPPPTTPPPPTGGPPPPPPGGCGFQGLTSCGDTCCPAGSLCAGSACVPPPPPPAVECKPACPPGKKCHNGQCVDASSPCGVCPPGSPCCTCSYGSYCGNPDLACRC